MKDIKLICQVNHFYLTDFSIRLKALFMLLDKVLNFRDFTRKTIPRLAKDKIHIWLIEHNQLEGKLADLADILSWEERQRLLALTKIANRKIFILSHGFLRLLTGAYLGLKPQEISFSFEPGGKPYLAEYPELHFNLSHCRIYTLLAFSKAKRIGIDIEEIRPRQALSLIWDYLTGSQGKWQGQAPHNRLPDFYQSWTRQEAFAKASGIGLAGLEPSLAEKIACKNLRRLPFAGNLWSLRNIKVDRTHAAALCFEGTKGTISFHKICS